MRIFLAARNLTRRPLGHDLATAAARDTIRLAVASATASTYITLLGLDTRLSIARQTVAARADALRLAVSRDRAGYSPKLELRQAEAAYDEAAQIVAQFEAERVTVEAQCELGLMGEDEALGKSEVHARKARQPAPDALLHSCSVCGSAG